MEGDNEVVPRNPYPDLLMTGITRLKDHLAKFGYGLAETRPRADRYVLRFGVEAASILVSISVDAVGWQLALIGRGVKYDTGDLTTKVPTLEALDELLSRVSPPPAPFAPPKPQQKVAESYNDNRLLELAGVPCDSPQSVDDLLVEDKRWPMMSRRR